MCDRWSSCGCGKRAAEEAAKRAACPCESRSACVCGMEPREAAQKAAWYNSVGREEEAASKRRREYHAEMEVKKATAELLKRKGADASAAGAASTCAACAATTHISKASFLCPLHPKNVWKCLCVSWAQCKCGKKQAALAAERAAYAAKHARPVPATTTNPNPFAMKKGARKAAVARMGANDTE